MLILRHFYGGQTATHTLLKPSTILGSSEKSDIVFSCSNSKKAWSCEVTASLNSADRFEIIAHGKLRFEINGKKCYRAFINTADRIVICDHIFIVDQSNTAGASSENPATSAVYQGITEFARSLGSKDTVHGFLANAVDGIVKGFQASHAYIISYDSSDKPTIVVSWQAENATDTRYSDSIVEQALSLRAGILLENALTDERFKNAESIVDLKLASAMCSPILSGEKVIGAVYVGSNAPVVSFTHKELDLLNLYALVLGSPLRQLIRIEEQQHYISQIVESQQKTGMVATSSVILKTLSLANSFAVSDIAILIEGETGTGKDLMAHYIHRASRRAEHPFVIVNCSALRKELLESELFGHVRGSFTGAIKDHSGLFKTAHKGTIFLDEIGEFELELQAKLLRTLETGAIRPIGSATEENIDVRIVCATNRDLKAMVDRKEFRADLYYRLNQCDILMPPLRERGCDIELLARFFLDKYKANHPLKHGYDFHPSFLRFLTAHTWPGNVRELASTIHRCLLVANEELIKPDTRSTEGVQLNFETATRDFQKNLVLRALEMTGGNKEQAAALLGIHRSTIFRYIET